MVTRTLCVALLTTCACYTPQPDYSDAHLLAGYGNADFAVLAEIESFKDCQGQGDCRPVDQPLFTMKVRSEKAYYGVLTGRYSDVGTLDPESVMWWSKGQPVRILLIGRNGAPTGWTAPQAFPGDPTRLREPICGLETSDAVVVPVYDSWVYDAVNRTFIDTVYIGAVFRRDGAVGHDREGNVLPDSLGERDSRIAKELGVVITEERAEEDLLVAAQKNFARQTSDADYATGTCVYAVQ